MLPLNRKQPENKSELEEAYNALNQMFLKATQEVIPQKKSKKKKKPKLQIMSEKILTAIKWKKEAFHLWKTNGRPKNSDNTYTINKKIQLLNYVNNVDSKLQKREYKNVRTL